MLLVLSEGAVAKALISHPHLSLCSLCDGWQWVGGAIIFLYSKSCFMHVVDLYN
jgi:hypothetical protein